ncbi:MAG: hypothetical protein J0I34_16955 [Pseudonocardia sp.]|uniref:hypothetical protein n=1 Tax=unclassified Pseudonocardia TaxID=2619320 RepID=UPI00086E5AB4|nr:MULTISPECIES: hypothetical protein [unclassified Pseudonocardia]MBN9110455.1 hypothetical protein [Pseudonocardia sp.]ODU29777.1 MAG: hypothetical protein ABS80_01290 [Pseudonocardia sp. SCN 72-51]ODV03464.1 MAG: hypothetical protein ABT15_22805 [Pseudonocardia sp. SCN 73-27]
MTGGAAPLRLTAALSRNTYTEPVLHGAARADGLVLDARAMHPSEMFWRQLKNREFDVSEMSLASMFILHAAGNRDWLPLPVFTSRRFFHAHVLVRADVAASRPADLAGLRVGVPEYQQTAAVWARGVLRDDHGLDPRDVRWVMERPAERSHAGVSGFTVPAEIDLTVCLPGVALAELLAAGDLDALLLNLPARNLVDVGNKGVDVEAITRPLFPDRRAETARYWRAHGVWPANHCIVVRRQLAEEHPWLPGAVRALFDDAKRRVLRGRGEHLESLRDMGVLDGAQAAELGRDRMPYGLDDPAMLDTLARYVAEQGLTPGLVDPADLFPGQQVAVT